jgi:hypothetical protein
VKGENWTEGPIVRCLERATDPSTETVPEGREEELSERACLWAFAPKGEAKRHTAIVPATFIERLLTEVFSERVGKVKRS